MAVIQPDEKVFIVSNGTNTTYSGSTSLKAMQQWYTMQDVIDTVGTGGAGTLQQTVDNGNNIITGTTKTTLNGTSISIIDTDTLLGNILYKDSLRFNRDNGSGATKRIDLLAPTNITNNRTITFPDASGTVALLPTVDGNYPNDAAAEAAGIKIGSLYHTAGVVKVRLT